MHQGGGRDSLKVVAVATDGAFRTISNGNSINDLNYQSMNLHPQLSKDFIKKNKCGCLSMNPERVRTSETPR